MAMLCARNIRVAGCGRGLSRYSLKAEIFLKLFNYYQCKGFSSSRIFFFSDLESRLAVLGQRGERFCPVCICFRH